MPRTRLFALCLLACSLTPRAAAAADADYRDVGDWLLLLAGAASGFVLHEGGHLLFDVVVQDEPRLKAVKLGPFPFFAINAHHPASRNELYAASMMGFLVEAAYTEAILAHEPELVRHHQPFLEGMLVFHFALDLGYAITGFLNVGPRESDINSMARAASIPPAAVGSILLVPLVMDTLRYLMPATRSWTPWVSVGARLFMFGGVFVL